MSINVNKNINFNPFKEYGIAQDVRLVIYDEFKREFTHLIIIKSKEEYELEQSELELHSRYTYKYQIKVDKKWTDEIRYKPLKIEKKTDDGIKYLFYPMEEDDYLIVGFQGLNRNPGYNYVRSLKDSKASRLYIKDDYGEDLATRTSYYLGPNKSLEIADKVLNLIEKIRVERGIKKENVICIGSSKGGYASLYFVYRAKYGKAIVGGPQTLLGDYLSDGKLDKPKHNSILRPILKYLSGDLNENNVDWLNNVLLETVRNSKHDPEILIHVGKGEPHYKRHVLPFVDFTNGLKLKNIKLDLEDYENHDELVRFFPNLLKEKVLEITNEIK